MSRCCEKCKRVFKNSNTLRSHRYKCQGNNKKTTRLELAQDKSVPSQPKYSRKCIECGIIFHSKGGFNKHVKKYHKQQEHSEEPSVENEYIVEIIDTLSLGEDIEIVTV